MARKQPVTARLNGSVGASLGEAFGLMFEDMTVFEACTACYVVASLPLAGAGAGNGAIFSGDDTPMDT